MEVLFERYNGETLEYYLMMGVRGAMHKTDPKYLIEKKELEVVPKDFKLLGVGYLDSDETIFPIDYIEEACEGKALLLHLNLKSRDRAAGPAMMRLICRYGYLPILNKKNPAYLYKRNKT